MSTRTKLTFSSFVLSIATWTSVFADRWGLSFVTLLLVWSVQLGAIAAMMFYTGEIRKESVPVEADSAGARRIKRKRLMILAVMPLTALAFPVIAPVLSQQISLKINAFTGLFTGTVMIGVWLWQLRKQKVQLAEFKVITTGLLLAMILLAEHDATLLVRSYAISRIGAEMNHANTSLIAKGRSLNNAEAFIMDIRAIDLGYAPSDFKLVFQEYVEAMDQGLQAIRKGDRVAADATSRRTEAAKAKMVEISRRY